MGLKNFHIVLISLSSLLTAVFGVWAVAEWREAGGLSLLALAAFSFALAGGLLVYVVWFARRVHTRDEEDRNRRKTIKPLVLTPLIFWIASRPADACSVCYGEASGPIIDGARMGVFLLFGLVAAVQVAFVIFFICLWRRARRSGSSGESGLAGA